LLPITMIDKDPRDLIERMCACLHGWSALWGPPANSPTRILVDEARRYLAQPEPKPPSLKQQALAELEQLRGDANSIKEYKRNSKFTELKPYDYFAKDSDFMETTEWYNGEGVDVAISSNTGEQHFSLSWGEWQALKALIGPDEDDDDEEDQ
jgi:hypothetical protein